MSPPALAGRPEKPEGLLASGPDLDENRHHGDSAWSTARSAAAGSAADAALRPRSSWLLRVGASGVRRRLHGAGDGRDVGRPGAPRCGARAPYLHVGGGGLGCGEHDAAPSAGNTQRPAARRAGASAPPQARAAALPRRAHARVRGGHPRGDASRDCDLADRRGSADPAAHACDHVARRAAGGVRPRGGPAPRSPRQAPAAAGELDDVDRCILDEIARRREVADLQARTDILSLLLQARDEDGAALADAELRDELVTLLVAGHETTAGLLSWALTEIAAHPDAQARLAAGETGLAAAAVTETLRLHPPVPLGSLRRLRRPRQIAGWRLPAGATVASCSLLIHRRADVYERPDEWRLDRFVATRPPAGAWLPFGGGVRRCVGAAFAQFEALIVIDELLRALELRPDAPARRRVGRRGIVIVPARGGPVLATARG